MKRSEFLQSLGLGAVGLVLPKTLLTEHQVKIYDNFIRGLQHYDFGKVENLLQIGNELGLKREKENQYDAFAVEVYFEEFKLGYLPAFENIVIANLLDAKADLTASISFIQKEKNPYKAQTIAIEIFANLITPTPQLITELQNKRADQVEDLYRRKFEL